MPEISISIWKNKTPTVVSQYSIHIDVTNVKYNKLKILFQQNSFVSILQICKLLLYYLVTFLEGRKPRNMRGI